MPLYTELNLPQARPLSVEDYKPTFAEYLKASWEDADLYDPGKQIEGINESLERRYGVDVAQMAEQGGLTAGLEDARELEPVNAMSEDEQKAFIESEGLTGQLKPGPYYNKPELEYLAQLKHEELERALIREKAPAAWAPVGFLAGLTESFTDPINVASGFLPVVGEARQLKMLAQAGSAWGRAGVRAGVGALEGVVGALGVEPAIAGGRTSLQRDYELINSLMNVAFGASMGAILRPLGGAVGEWRRRRAGQRNPWEYVPSTERSEKLRLDTEERLWKSFQESGSTELTREHATGAAAYFDAVMRGVAYDRKTTVEEMYRRHRVLFRGKKMDIVEVAEGIGANASEIAGRAPENMDPTVREALEIVNEGQEALAGVEDVDSLHQAMYRSKAENIREFLKEAATYGDKPAYVFGNITRKDAGIENAAIELRGERVRHIQQGHPDFDNWEGIEGVVQKGLAYEIAPNKETGLPGRAFVVEQDGKSFVVMGYVQNTKRGQRFVIESCFDDNVKRAENWLKERQAIPLYQSNGASPSHGQARITRDVLSELERNDLSETRISTNEAEGNTRYQDGVEGGRAQGTGEGNAENLNQAMYRAREEDILSFTKRVAEEGQEAKKSFYSWEGEEALEGWEICLPSDTVFHQRKRHLDITDADYERLPEAMQSIEQMEFSARETGMYGKPFLARAHVEGQGYGIVFEANRKGRLFITTFFKDSDNALEDWQIREKKKASMAPAASETESARNPGVGHGRPVNEIIKEMLDSVKKSANETPRARVSFNVEDAFALVEFFKNADASSAPHEMTHIFRRIMSELYEDPNTSEAFKERYRKACEFVGAEPGAMWTREQEEKFARAGERFLLEGVSPNPQMHEVLEHYKQWLTEIYGSAERSGLEISDEMRKVFSGMLGTAEDGDANFRYAMGKLLEDKPEAVDTRLDAPDLPENATPEQAIEAYTADSTARVDEAFETLADQPEAQEQIRQAYEAELNAADAEIENARALAEMREAVAACELGG